jgi:hypothetical protein
MAIVDKLHAEPKGGSSHAGRSRAERGTSRPPGERAKTLRFMEDGVPALGGSNREPWR